MNIEILLTLLLKSRDSTRTLSPLLITKLMALWMVTLMGTSMILQWNSKEWRLVTHPTHTTATIPEFTPVPLLKRREADSYRETAKLIYLKFPMAASVEQAVCQCQACKLNFNSLESVGLILPLINTPLLHLKGLKVLTLEQKASAIERGPSTQHLTLLKTRTVSLASTGHE